MILRKTSFLALLRRNSSRVITGSRMFETSMNPRRLGWPQTAHLHEALHVGNLVHTAPLGDEHAVLAGVGLVGDVEADAGDLVADCEVLDNRFSEGSALEAERFAL